MALLGRSEIVEQCVTDVADGRSVMVCGAHGLGKTAVLDAVVHHLGNVVPVTRIHGADGVSDVPLAPFSDILSGLSLVGATPLEVHAHVPSALVAMQTRLVVDDADLLDASSLVLLGHVARAGVPVVAAVSKPDGLGRSIASDVDRGLWVVRDLEPLDADSLVCLAAEVLGGEPSAEAASALIARANGSPRVLREVATVALRGAHATARGVVLGPRLATHESMQRWAQMRALLDPTAVVAMERIAIAGSLPLEAVDDLVLTALRTQGLVVVGEAVESATWVLHDAVVQSLSPALARRRYAEVADLLAHIDPDAHAVTIAWLAARSGRMLAADAATAAADQALRDGRPDWALEIVQAVAASVPVNAHVALVHGAALSALERLDEAESALAGAAGVGDKWALRLCQELGLLHAVRRGRPAEAVEHVTVALAGVSDPDSRAVIEGELVKWRLMAGEAGVAPDGMTASASADLQVGMALIQAMVASLDGPPHAALEIVDRGKRALAGAQHPSRHAHDLLALSEFLARCFDGHVGVAETAAAERRHQALIEADSAVGLWEFASGELALHAGRLAAAESFARRAVIHLTWRDFTGLKSPAIALHAAAAARLGHLHAAARFLASLPDDAHQDVKVALHVARGHAEVRRQRRDLTEAARLLSQAGERAVAESHRHLGVLVCDEAWMVTPTRKIASQLEEHAQSSALATLLCRRMDAYHRGDIDELLDTAELLGAAGVPGRVMHVEELAAMLLDAEGHVHDARRIRARHRATHSYGVVAPWPDGMGDVSLTQREREIAALAAARVRSKEIAARLGLSVRTVDNHLGNVFRKVGIQGRDELAAALATAEL